MNQNEKRFVFCNWVEFFILQGYPFESTTHFNYTTTTKEPMVIYSVYNNQTSKNQVVSKHETLGLSRNFKYGYIF